jgi:hypothetical protein
MTVILAAIERLSEVFFSARQLRCRKKKASSESAKQLKKLNTIYFYRNDCFKLKSLNSKAELLHEPEILFC